MLPASVNAADSQRDHAGVQSRTGVQVWARTLWAGRGSTPCPNWDTLSKPLVGIGGRL